LNATVRLFSIHSVLSSPVTSDFVVSLYGYCQLIVKLYVGAIDVPINHFISIWQKCVKCGARSKHDD